MPQKATPSKPHKVQSKTTKSTNEKRKVHGKEQNVISKSSYPLAKETQQVILTYFASTLSLTPASLPDLQKTIQSVKSALYSRDFTSAFGTEEFLHAYSARWSPSRSLGYAQLLLQESEKLFSSSLESTNVVCLGGGAGAELVGLTAGWAVMQCAQTGQSHLKLDLVDSAAWESVLGTLGQNLQFLVPDSCGVEYAFHQVDVLAPPAAEALHSLLANADLVTLFFTLNELYAAGLGVTTRFLLELGEAVKPGTRLCIVDSAGSYAGVVLDQDQDQDEQRKQNGKDQVLGKRYPMAWMLDHTLLELNGQDEEGIRWRKLLVDDSRWFRRDKTLEYPLQLEDMRYQAHIFEKLEE